VCVSCSAAVTTTTTCENSTQDISCSSGYVISIVSAAFGRSDGTTCGLGNVHVNLNDTSYVSALSGKSLVVAQGRCHGRNSCTLPAATDVFGQPCAETDKYLTVGHFCVSATSLSYNVQCMVGAAQSLSCSSARCCVSFAVFGRLDTSTCNSTSASTNT